MPEHPPFVVYRDQLTSLYRGLALWNPNPQKDIYDEVSIGDVGYSNKKLGEPVPYETLSFGSFTNITENPLEKGEHCSRSVSAETNVNNTGAMVPKDMEGVTYKCRRRGALLSLPTGATTKKIIRKKAFEDYVRDHVVSWFTWTQDNDLGVERIEELILVSGCTLTTSWAVAAFMDNTMEAEISLASRTLSANAGASFAWNNARGPVLYNNSPFDPQKPPTTPDQCVFIKGFRAKRILFWTRPVKAAAEPLPDDPDNRRDDEIQVSEVPGALNYRDPVIGVLDYIVDKCLEDTVAEDTIAIAHDDDLHRVKDAENMTADAIEKFLRETKMPLRVENGAAFLCNPRNDEPPVSNDLAHAVSNLSATLRTSGIIYPSAGVSEGPSLIVRLYDTVKAVKVHKGRLSNLARQCDLLLSTVREYSPRFPGTEVSAEADEIERAIEGILMRVSGWARLSNKSAFLKQNEIQIGIEECHREVTMCTDRFMVALSLVKASESKKQEMAQQRDHRQIFDMIAQILDAVRQIPQLIPLEASQLLEQLLPPQLEVVGVDGQPGQASLPQVAPSPRISADQSGKVCRVSEEAAIEGTRLLFYDGEWISDGEPTALGRLRDQSPDSQKRFKEWIESSLELTQHRNILNFVGHVTIDNIVYSINPNLWIENGNIREYLRRNPDVDRIRLLSEVASGMEFLHERGIVHGDLCDKNILINRYSQAIVCGFDLYEFSKRAVSDARWFAPEWITSDNVTTPTEKADIWSFGLLCLEVFTGKDPYHGLSDFYVPVLLSQGTHPDHPGSMTLGLTPEMWDLMQSCWQFDPALRPSMSEIRSTMRDMLPRRGARRPSTGNIDIPVPVLFTPGRPLAPLPEDPTNSNTQVPLASAPPSTTLNFSAFRSLSSDLRSVISSSSRSTSSTSGLSMSGSSRRAALRRIFGIKKSQTTPDTSPEISSESLLMDTPNNSSPFLPLGGALPHKHPPKTTGTTPTKETSKMPVTPPKRSAPLIINLPQSRIWEPVNPVVLRSMEMAASDSECILWPATDGSVSSGNLEGLISRFIGDIVDPSGNDHFRRTFLTIYQLFATSERLFNILKRRFESSEFDPVTARSRYPILLFIESWLKKGFADEDLKCTSMINEFVLPLVDSETISEKMEEKAKEIASLIKDPDYVRLRQPKDCPALRGEPAEQPQGMTPNDLAAALTVVEGDRFECITYWDYVNFTLQRPNLWRIEVFNIVHDLIKVWVQTTVLKSDAPEERMKTYEEWIHTAEACRALNNLSSTSAIVLALMSPMIRALTITCESKAEPGLHALAEELTPTDGVYLNTLQNAATRDLIPWLDLHLSTLNSSFAQSNPIIEVDGHPLIDFKYCSKIAEQIESLVQYSPPRTRHTTRLDVLAYVEYGLESSRGDDVLRNAEERSAHLAGEEQEIRARREKMKRLGFPWPTSPLRRK